MLAGIFIALAACGSVSVSPDLAGIIFSTGLIMVIIGGAELFTGNCLTITDWIDGKTSLGSLMSRWTKVYIANFIGAMLVVLTSGIHADVTQKLNLTFTQAFFEGVWCNVLVCMAVIMARKADSTAGKVLVTIFPVWLFVACGFEHSIANMFFIPSAIMAGTATWSGFIINIVPVTMGNMFGGVLVAYTYWRGSR